MPNTEVRAYRPQDRDGVAALFGRAGKGSPTESLWGDPVSEADVYLNPYLDHEPESVFIATMDGDPVGYLVGSLGGGALPSEDERLVAAIRRHRLLLRPQALKFFARSSVDLLGAVVRRRTLAGELVDPRWPAHLHINVEQRARGTGAAQRLVDLFVRRVRAEGVPGVHLQTLVENARAARFFAGLGFIAHGPAPRVPGLRHRGKPVHQLTMVRDLGHE